MTGEAPRLALVREIEALPEALIRDPLTFLFAEHWRHRQFCRALGDVAELAVAPPRLLRQMAGFLRVDMGLHVEDDVVAARAQQKTDFHRICSQHAMAETQRSRCQCRAAQGAKDGTTFHGKPSCCYF